MNRLLLVLLPLTSIGTVHAQPLRALDVNIGAEFTAGTKVAPPGSYRFAAAAGGLWLQVTGAGASANLRIIDRLRGPDVAFREGSVVFDQIGKTRVLSEVWIPGEGGLVVAATPQAHTHHIVMAMTGSTAGNPSGKTVYERTCRKCHGPNGQGNPAADKFFEVSIPRLDSPYVQDKTDSEIKEVITQGRRNMDPVQMKHTTTRHLLAPSTVDAVVAYVRTFQR